MARLKGVQTSLSRRESIFLENLESEILEEYDNILEQEELFWWQKPRANWWVEGENNTKFFHTHASIIH